MSEETIEMIFDSVSYDIGVALDCGKLAGRLTAMLYNVYTLPEYRGRGIMARMLPEVIRLAREAGAVELKMTAEKKAIPLYERMGFHVNEDAMKMVL